MSADAPTDPLAHLTPKQRDDLTVVVRLLREGRARRLARLAESAGKSDDLPPSSTGDTRTANSHAAD